MLLAQFYAVLVLIAPDWLDDCLCLVVFVACK